MVQAPDVTALLCVTAITVVVASVVLLRPVARRLPDLLQILIEQRRPPAAGELPEHDRERLLVLEARLDRMDRWEGSAKAMPASGPRGALSGTAAARTPRGLGQ